MALIAASPACDAGRPVFSRRYTAWLLTVLVVTYACAFIDRIVIAILGPAIIRELHLSDLEFGLLGGLVFAVFYSAFGLPVARLAERKNRINIISISVALWSAMTALSGLAQSYWHLLVCRMGVGIGEAGCSPPAHSLLSDHYPASKRASALSIYAIGLPLGATLGAVAGGWFGQQFGWRSAFAIVGLPGLLLALIVKLTLREPPRGYAEGAAPDRDAPSLASVVHDFWSKPALFHMALGCSVTTMAGGAMNLFAPSYFVRRFDMTMAEVGLLYGVVQGISLTIGSLTGGFGVDAGARRDVRWYAWAPAIGVALSAPLYLSAYREDSALAAMAFILLGGVGLSISWAPSFAAVQNMVGPRMRASAAAMLLLLMNVLGQGLGPAVVGVMSDAGAARAFGADGYAESCLGTSVSADLVGACASASAAGLQQAIIGAAAILFWAAVHYALAARSIRRDLVLGPV